MRFLTLTLLGGLLCVSSACGLDQDGSADLVGGDDGGTTNPLDGPDSSIANIDGSFTPDASEDTTLGTGDDGNAPGSDGNGSSDGNGGPDAHAPPPDANTPDAPSTCGPVEICGNGIDDDCNGKTDCADPACKAGWVCEPLPQGWTIVEYELNGHDACTAGYASPTSLLEGPVAPTGACACSGCGVTNEGACTTFSGDVDGIASCGTAFGPLPTGGGACTKFPATVFGSTYTTNGTSKELTNATWTGPGACSPNPQPPPGDPTFNGQGESCAASPSPALGCASGDSCVQAPAGAFHVCIQQAGTTSCPPNGGGFNWTLYPVGTAANPLTCNACTCSVEDGACTGVTETLFTDPGCSTAPPNVSTPITVDGKCDPIADGPKGQKYAAYTFSATPTAQCSTTGGGLAAAPSLAGASTICCSQ